MTALAIEELIHIDIDGMAASGQHHAFDAGIVEALSQIVALCHALFHVVEVAAFVHTNSQRHNVTAGHAAIGVVAIAGDLLDLQANAHVHLRGPVFIEVGEVLPE